MNYIYNILVNLEYIPYDIFEWDNVLEIDKTTLFRLDNITTLLDHDIIIDKEFLKLIKGKTKSCKYLEYACAFVSLDISLFCVFNKEGKIIYRSLMLYNEEYEALNNIDNLKTYDIKYKILNKIDYNFLISKEDNIKKQYIIKEIKKIINEKNISKLTYLYYDCFGNHINNNIDIIKEIENNYDSIKDNLYTLLKM